MYNDIHTDTLWQTFTVCELEAMAIEIVDLPSYKMVDFSIVMLVYQRVYK